MASVKVVRRTRLSLATFPNGLKLPDLATGLEYQLLVRKTAKGKVLAESMFQDGPQIESLALSLDGKTLASTDGDLATLWDVATCRKYARFRAERSVSSVALSSDGGLIAMGLNEEGMVEVIRIPRDIHPGIPR